jgi:hypothetical protein
MPVGAVHRFASYGAAPRVRPARSSRTACASAGVPLNWLCQLVDWGTAMTVNDGVPPTTAVPAPTGAVATTRRLLRSLNRFLSDRETVLPRPLGWWRAL